MTIHTHIGQAVGAQNFRLQPRQVVDANAILLARNGDQNVLALEHLHLLEATARDQLVYLSNTTTKNTVKTPTAAANPPANRDYLALTGPVQQHQAVLGADQQIDAPQGGAQDLRVEALLVLANLRRVAGRIVRRRRHVHVHVALAARRSRAAGAEAERQEAALLLLVERKRVRMQHHRGHGRGGSVFG